MDMIYTNINNKRLMKVKVFNRIQEEKFTKDMEIWKNENRYGINNIPYLPIYIFTKDNGKPRKKGYVVTKENSHKFYLTKEQVFINEGMRVDI